MTPSWARAWLKDDSAAVTVDWTVLAAAIVGLGVTTAAAVRTGTGALGTDIQNSLTSASVSQLGELGGSGLVSAALSVYEPLYYAAADYADLVAWAESIDADARLAIYTSDLEEAQRMFDEGEIILAQGYFDWFTSTRDAMINMGEDLPETTIDPDVLYGLLQT